MKQSDIKADRFYTNGKLVRRVDQIVGVDECCGLEFEVWWSDPNGENRPSCCMLKTMARWARWEVNPSWVPVWPNVKKMNVKEFVERGFLFELNRSVLHPMGLAMYVTDGVLSPMVLGGIINSMDDPDGFVFEPKTFIEGHEKWHKFMTLEGGERLNERRDCLGFVQQTSAGQGDV